jgi:energy-coupling factor transport system permease protein
LTARPGPIAYAPGGSWLHRLSPIPKLAWLAAAVCVAFTAYHLVPLAAITVAGLALAVAAGLGRVVLRVLAWLAPLAASILVLQSLAPAVCGDACTPLATLGPFTIYAEGLSRGLSLVARILAMEVAAVVVLASTHPSDLFAALARLRVPFTLNFMIAMTLHLVPVLQREVGLVLAAQRARGMRTGGAGAILPAFVPVFAGAVERMRELAISLESRAFGAPGPRTSYRRVRFGAADRALAVAGVAATVSGTVLGLTAWGSAAAPVVVVPAPIALAIVAGAAAVFAGVLVAAVRALGRA